MDLLHGGSLLPRSGAGERGGYGMGVVVILMTNIFSLESSIQSWVNGFKCTRTILRSTYSGSMLRLILCVYKVVTVSYDETNIFCP